MSRFVAAVFAAALLLPACLAAGQAAAPIPSGSQQDQSAAAALNGDEPAAGALDSSNGRIADRDGSLLVAEPGRQAMPCSEQIADLLEQNPDVAAELKQQLAEQMEQRGVEVDAADISDQVLNQEISTDATLRASLLTVLRARALAGDADGDLNGSGDIASASLSARAGDADCMEQSVNPLLGGVTPGVAESRMQSDLQRHTVLEKPRSAERGSFSTDPPAVLHQPSPLDLPSMRDLYTQIPEETGRLERFGSDVFLERRSFAVGREVAGGNIALDVPIGPDYVLGSGDTLSIDVWGGFTQSITRTVDRDGRILLPEAGALQIAGLALGDAQRLIGEALRRQFRDAQIAVTLTRLRSVRVYVVGDVQRPGAYDISSLATPLSALYAAGGPTAVGSLRFAQHYRGDRLIDEFDLYDFLLHGVRHRGARFESGDTLLVPPAGPQIAISGAVRRPAIYELRSGESTLGVVINDAGGLTPAASLDNIRIERIDAHQQRVTVHLPDGAIQDPPGDPDVVSAFAVKDGDRIRVEPILPYSQRAVYLAGHVVRPGRIAYSNGMQLSDVLHGYQDLLPEPAARGEIVRLVPPDLHAETIDFNVPDVLIGNANVNLQPFDTIRIFGRYQADAPTVTVRGEVLHPGTYPMSAGMTAAQLVRLAGGFRRDALVDSADLTSYETRDGRQVIEQTVTLRIGAAVRDSDPGADAVLKPGDTLSIHQIANWEEIGQSITIRGQVTFPGSYGFHDGERLSSVLRRAGGFLPTAYPEGAVLIRAQVKDLEQSSRDELIRQIEVTSAAARTSPGAAGANAPSALQMIREQEDQVVRDLKENPPSGRMVIHIAADIDSWAGTSADIELRRDDVLTIPRQPGFVLVTGQVYNATALTYIPGKTAEWYLSRAGGANAAANRKEIFVIHANGSVVGRRSGDWLGGNVLSTRLDPGDVVVVPQKIIGGSLLWRGLLTSGQLAATAAITAGIAASTL